MNAPIANSGDNFLVQLTLTISGDETARYKSIGPLTWEDIPPFVILTGLNGSGKTQLLELLAYRLTNTPLPSSEKLDCVVSGGVFRADDVAYLPSMGAFSGGSSSSIGQLQTVKQQYCQILQNRHHNNNDLRAKAKYEKLNRLMSEKNISNGDQEQVTKILPDDFSFMLDDVDVVSGLSHVFIAYQSEFADQLMKGKPKDIILKDLGQAPWEVVNKALLAAGFSYLVKSPLEQKLYDMYSLCFKTKDSEKIIYPHDLSSGEKVILQLVLWLYNSRHHGRFPKLFLLDEPDAHLHPSMARQFMNVIKEVLVDQFKVRVILTTHSPSTVALAPEESIFVMSRDAPRIRRPKSKDEAVGLLTSGLVFVSPATRYIIVEDNADVEFYSAIRDILSDYGPSKDASALKPSLSLVFMPASWGEGRQKTSGGASIVKQWIEKFNSAPFHQLFRGVIDLDDGNTPTDRIEVVSRYSIENYLLDPIVVFGVLIEEGAMPSRADIKVSQGDEHRLREMSEQDLQQILVIIQIYVDPLVSSNLSSEERATRVITFTNKKQLSYPAWMITRRGHDLMRLYQQRYGGAKVISPPRLIRSLQRVRMIPVELADLMHKLQS